MPYIQNNILILYVGQDILKLILPPREAKEIKNTELVRRQHRGNIPPGGVEMKRKDQRIALKKQQPR